MTTPLHIRHTAVAGQFYPADAAEIERMIAHFNRVLDDNVDMRTLESKHVRAVISPHAGYIYSGFTANAVLRILGAQRPTRVVVIGPSHRVYLRGVSVSDFDRFETPLGMLPIDKRIVATLLEMPGFTSMPEAHHEHSTEVQMPFIKHYLPDVSVVELVYGEVAPETLSEAIDLLLEDPETAIVISTDLSHYHSLEEAKRRDAVCLAAIDKRDRALLHRGCEACGKLGVEAMLISAQRRGLEAQVIDYRTSADASGDTSQVVGYTGAIFSEGGE